MNTNQITLRETTENGYIRILNQGSFVAYFSITYFINGEFFRTVSPQFPVLQSKTLAIPYNATNITLYVSIAIYWQTWRGIYEEHFDTPPKKCYRLYGVTFYAGCEEVPCNNADNGILPDPPIIVPNCCCCCCKPQCKIF